MDETAKPKLSFSDIPKFPSANYEVSAGWSHLESTLDLLNEEGQLDLDPDFQRAHVWTREQQIAYVEYILRGGEVAKNITFNCAGWPSSASEPIVLVDGKQRLEAARAFLRGDLPAFGRKISEYEGKLNSLIARFNFRICSLATREEVLQLYLNINAGGTPHAEDEIQRVRDMLRACQS